MSKENEKRVSKELKMRHIIEENVKKTWKRKKYTQKKFHKRREREAARERRKGRGEMRYRKTRDRDGRV